MLELLLMMGISFDISLNCPPTAIVDHLGQPRQMEATDQWILSKNRCSAIYQKPMCTKKIIKTETGHRHVICSEEQTNETKTRSD